MKMIRLIFMLAIAAPCAFAQQPAAKPSPTPAQNAPKTATGLRGKLIYKPAGPGVPSGRIDAGSRGDGDEIASLYVIAPETIGQTANAQPTLFWFQTKAAKLPFEISVLKPNNPTPVMRVRQSGETTGGFHRVSLAEKGITLEPGVDYQWVVALVRDPQSRSRDIVSSGWIRYDSGNAGNRKDTVGLAAAGFWYDCVSALFAQIDARPGDAQLAADRRDLFTQVRLPPLPAVPGKKVGKE